MTIWTASILADILLWKLFYVSEDEPVPDLLKKKELLKSNWVDEDLEDDDVKESWEDDDEDEPAKVRLERLFGCNSALNFLVC